jgi:hypothetical protein
MKSRLALESLTRRQLARRVCQQLHWVNQGGRLKEMSCRVALLRMEREGLIRLPAPRPTNTHGRPRSDALQIPRSEGPLTLAVGELRRVRLELVETESGARGYRALMRRHHYLGCKPMAGAQLRYLIWSGNWLLGGLEFKKQMLERMEETLGDHHSGELRRESAEVKAERIIREELRRKSDPSKLALANRLRRETILSVKVIAERLHLGSPKSARARLRKSKEVESRRGERQANQDVVLL